MILFCDTSALVKLYIAENGSETVRSAAEKAEAVSVSRLAWVELHAAVARRGRESPQDQQALEGVKRQFTQDWKQLVVLEVNQACWSWPVNTPTHSVFAPTMPFNWPVLCVCAIKSTSGCVLPGLIGD